MVSKKTIGADLKELRETDNISKYRVGKDGDMVFSQIDNIESGAKNYTIDTLLAYVNALGLKITFEKNGDRG
jgi:transcriptional regulator with XRE-family HTH domain